jgi:hypothetical protein
VLIPSRAEPRAICPTWSLSSNGREPPWDERAIDAAIAPELRSAVRAARARLLASLDRAADLIPGDGWLTGQRVRFSMDQGDTLRAMRAATSCRAAPWWCRLLTAYVEQARGEAAESVESQFDSALSAMSAEERCTWTNPSALLGRDGRTAYELLPCSARDSVNRIIWWLSDPVWLIAGNERRTEHYGRLVLTALRSGTNWSERWDMREDGGGDAVREMVIRYGWPSFAWWGGQAVDAGHHG